MSDLDQVIRAVIFAADEAALEGDHRTSADLVRDAVRAAFECAIGNGLVQIVPPTQWPQYIAMTPPYEPLAG